jgi:ADP-ribose pyrophosphatase YjhB (NUDIX family)
MFKKALFTVASKLVFQPLFRQTRGMTLGVRVAVLNAEAEVLLVHHTYSPGYLLPGGGVERGEILSDAAAREIREEGGIETLGEPQLHGIFSNHAQYPGDHIACYIVRAFTRKPWSANLEIAEARFFPVAALPEGTTGGTRRRIAEILTGRKPSGEW